MCVHKCTHTYMHIYIYIHGKHMWLHVLLLVCNCQGFSGDRCQYAHVFCDSFPCQNGGTCRPHDTGYSCQCPPGSAGDHCQYDTANECESLPCQHGGTCINRIGRFQCVCPALWNGVSCEMFDDAFEGGVGHRVTPATTASTRDDCVTHRCKQKANNGLCDVSTVNCNWHWKFI